MKSYFWNYIYQNKSSKIRYKNKHTYFVVMADYLEYFQVSQIVSLDKKQK